MGTIGKTATIVRDDDGEIIVRYHATDVVRFFYISADEDTSHAAYYGPAVELLEGDEERAHVRLDSGGWRTATTKRRMNQTADAYGLGYRVHQFEYAWYVEFLYGIRAMVPFVDGMTFEVITIMPALDR
jgi:hypothetical protein